MNPNREKELLEIVDKVIAEGPYKPNWDSLMEAPVPKWFKEQKLGIFVHWGLYSVPANSNEWYSRNMYIKGMPAYEHHIKTYGPQKDFGYKDFIPMFTAEGFDPKEWLDLFAAAGAGYVFQWQNITMDSRCMTANFLIGMWYRWDHIAIF